MIPVIVSVISFVLLVTTAVALYYQSEKVKADTHDRIQDIVSQINDSQYYGYKFDKNQDKNIQNIDKNVTNMYQSLTKLQNNFKFMEKNAVNKTDIGNQIDTKQANVDQLSAKKFSMANGTTKNNIVFEAGRTTDGNNEGMSAINFNGYTLNGDQKINKDKGRWRIVSNQVGTNDSLEIDQLDQKGTLNKYLWMSDGSVTLNNDKLRISNKYTGWADKAKDQAEIANDVTDFKKLMIVGNKSADGGARRVGVWDHLEVNGNQDVRGMLNAAGGISTGGVVSGGRVNAGDLNVQNKIFFKDNSFSTTPNANNSTDPFYMEKVIGQNGASSLRLTLNDDANKTFEVWGNSCGTGNCSGSGAVQHTFNTNGNAWHNQWLDARNVQGREMITTPNNASYLKSDGSIKGSLIVARDKLLVGESGAIDLQSDGSAKMNKIQLGNKWLLSGVGDTVNTGPANKGASDSWLRLTGTDGRGFYGGLAAGELYSARGTLTASDIRTKTDVCNLPQDEVAKFASLNPKKYIYKDDPKRRTQFGLIAQEVEKIYPNIVETGPNGLKSLRYNDLIPILIAKVKSMEAELVKLKSE